jgi:hypothetical protein
MHIPSLTFGILAGATQLWGYYLYNKHVTRPNATSWAIWSFSALLDLASYFFITGDWMKNILPATCALASIYIFTKALYKKRLERPDRKDVALLGTDLTITGIWSVTNAVVANLLFQISAVISFIPLVRAIRKGKTDERESPWMVWTTAYALMLVSIAVNLTTWVELAYPIVHMIIHTWVWYEVARYHRRSWFHKKGSAIPESPLGY